MICLPLSEPSSGWSIIYIRRWNTQLTILLSIARSRITYQKYLKYYDSNNMRSNNIMCIKIILSLISMIQYIIKIYNAKVSLLAWCSGLECIIFYLYFGGECCFAAVAYLACEDVVLGALVLFFILVSLVERSFRTLHLHMQDTLPLQHNSRHQNQSNLINLIYHCIS